MSAAAISGVVVGGGRAVISRGMNAGGWLLCCHDKVGYLFQTLNYMPHP